MPGSGPITNTRSLKGALVETISQLERARQKPVVVKILQQCRDYRRLVDDWDNVSPPPDEQFETIGQIMQLLGAAMNVTKDDDEPSIEVHTFEVMGDFDDDDALEEISLPPRVVRRAPPQAEVVELYRKPWRRVTTGVYVKTLQNDSGRRHLLLRLDAGAELDAHEQSRPECMFVLDGCIRHAATTVHAGSLLRLDRGADVIRSVGESTLLVLDSQRNVSRDG